MSERVLSLTYRAAGPADGPAVADLLRTSLGKQDDPHYEAFLAWKHQQNAFGASPAWVALDEDRVVGYRTFLRWRFVDDAGRVLRAVRAVDTATDPAYRGQGIFRRLTIEAVADLTRSGDAFVFNTPNDQSRPGYLSMGWSIVRRVPVAVLPRGVEGVRRMRSARVPAQLWSQDTGAGLPAAEALRDPDVARALLAHAPRSGLRTDRTPEYLAWRTAFGPLRYRVLLAEADPAAGGLIFRLRRRGPAVEATIVEAFVPDWRTGAALTRRLLRETRADYAIAAGSGVGLGMVPAPRLGPVLTARPLASTPPAADQWQLALADVELF